MSTPSAQVVKLKHGFQTVAIVGRVNVGKSSLFNRLVKSRMAIVQSEKGTTRDRVISKVAWKRKTFSLVDTGGYTWAKDAPFGDLINQEIGKAVSQADLIFFVCDGQAGLHPQDELIAEILRKREKNTFLVVNKLDLPQHFVLADEFYKLGFKQLVKVSATHDLGITELLDLTVETLPKVSDEEDFPKHDFSICIAGEPNSGKSTYFNALLGENRAIVSDIAGTTRDTIGEMIEYRSKKILLKDTAGIRPVKSMNSSVMRFSISRAKEAIRDTELVLFLFDSYKGLGRVAKEIGGYILENKKACVLIANKWDLVKKIEQSQYVKHLESHAPFLKGFPVVFVSAKNKKSVLAPLDQAIQTYEKHQTNVKTKDLNDFLSDFKKKQKLHEPVKLKFLTQIRTMPPHFLLMGRRLNLLKKPTVSFIKNQIQEHFQLDGTPIQLSLKEEE